jgi:hypothetical protein
VRVHTNASKSSPLRAQSDHAVRKAQAPIRPASLAVFRSDLLSPGAMVALQRQAGNSAVVSLLKAARPRHRPLHEASVQRCPGGCAPGACEGHEDRDSSDMVVSRVPASGAASGAKGPTPPSCRYTPKELAASKGSGGRAWPRTPTDDALLVYDFIHSAANLRSAHLTFLSDVVTDLHLDTAAPARTVSRIVGFSDCIANEGINAPIRIKRAGAVRKFLLDKGALAANVGPAVDDTSAIHPGDDSPGEQRDLMRSARLELSALPPPPCPPCPEDPRTAGCPVCQAACPPCPEDPRTPGCPDCHVCGPDIDSQLTTVLEEVQKYFRGLGGWRKHWSCQWLITPPMAIMAWDIHELFLPETDWLSLPPFSPRCGQPAPAAGGDIEDPTMCSNSVRAGGKCNLAGTVNYATFGIMAKECHTFYSGSPPLWTWKANIPFFTETGMKAFIGVYKTVTLDDRGPPTDFAVATYKGGPSGRPSTENRRHCSTGCPVSSSPPAFTFVWEPSHAR